MSHSPVPINWAKLWLGVAENSFSAQRYLTEKSSQKILTRKSLALEWQIWVQSIEPNHSQQSNTLQCLHYVLLTVSGKCGTKLCGGLAFQYSIILKLNWVWGLYGSRNLLTIVIGGKVVLGGIIYFFLRGGKSQIQSRPHCRRSVRLQCLWLWDSFLLFSLSLLE